MNNGEKEIHYFSWDDQFRKGPLVYQQRFDGSGERLGECKADGKVRGEVSATYLDYPKAAERAAQLLPSARIVVLLREPVSRLVSSFNMKWQVSNTGGKDAPQHRGAAPWPGIQHSAGLFLHSA